MAPPQKAENVIEVDGIRFDLRNRSLAALLAWLIPGAGHFYQGRRSKAAIFFIVIMTTYFVGFAIGGGHVVYASWAPGDRRWNYACQLGVGIAALPALVQTRRLRQHTDPRTGRTDARYTPLWGGLMAPPRRPVIEDNADDVAAWYARLGAGYEMGTWYTMIAGLLNILVIYDAYSGPLSTPISGRKRSSAEGDGSDSDTDDTTAPERHEKPEPQQKSETGEKPGQKKEPAPKQKTPTL